MEDKLIAVSLNLESWISAHGPHFSKGAFKDQMCRSWLTRLSHFKGSFKCGFLSPILEDPTAAPFMAQPILWFIAIHSLDFFRHRTVAEDYVSISSNK